MQGSEPNTFESGEGSLTKEETERSSLLYVAGEADPIEYYGGMLIVREVSDVADQSPLSERKTAIECPVGYDEELFERSRLWCEKLLPASYADQHVLSQYAAMDAINRDGLEKIDIASRIRQSAQPNISISEKRISNYGLLPLRIEDEESLLQGKVQGWYGQVEPGTYYNMWLDAPTGFALTYKGRPNALVAVSASNATELMIYQLQGVIGRKFIPDEGRRYRTSKIHARGLAPLRWRELLINVSSDLASSLGMRTLGIQSGQNNFWTKVESVEESFHFSSQAAIRAYDAPAQSQGFIKGHDGDWHKEIR